MYVEFLTALNGGTLSPTLVSNVAAAQTLGGTATANGSTQTAFAMTWSDGTIDNLDFQVVGAASTPEPSTSAMAAMALLLLAGSARFRRARRGQSVRTV